MSPSAAPEGPAFAVGIDVQSARDCAVAVLDASATLVHTEWIPGDGGLEARLESLLVEFPMAAFGIDSPRMPLPEPRHWYWRSRAWSPRRPAEKGLGRHCEVVVKAYTVGNPQWTPLEGAAPEWMEIGFRIFRALAGRAPTHEVFPSAAYQQLRSEPEVQMTLTLENFRPGPKDMLDAAVAALCVREFEAGRGCEVGGGDGYGTIVLPRPLAAEARDVLRWPSG